MINNDKKENILKYELENSDVKLEPIVKNNQLKTIYGSHFSSHILNNAIFKVLNNNTPSSEIKLVNSVNNTIQFEYKDTNSILNADIDLKVFTYLISLNSTFMIVSVNEIVNAVYGKGNRHIKYKQAIMNSLNKFIRTDLTFKLIHKPTNEVARILVFRLIDSAEIILKDEEGKDLDTVIYKINMTSLKNLYEQSDYNAMIKLQDINLLKTSTARALYMILKSSNHKYVNSVNNIIDSIYADNADICKNKRASRKRDIIKALETMKKEKLISNFSINEHNTLIAYHYGNTYENKQ